MDKIVKRSNNSGGKGQTLIGKSKKIIHLLEVAKKIADSNVPVLIQGESGTGKELVARFIHKNSSRYDKPFVVVDCASIPETLAEDELFGHERGAFTGAFKKHPGKFEQANGGTLLLDEVDLISPLIQTKLLRVVQEREFDRIGGLAPIQCDIRLISTTSKNLYAEVQKGNFRQDLYYRLYTIPIDIPPLRERAEDVILLAQYFIEKMCGENENIAISDETTEALMNYSWPGNVRELENVINRAAVLQEDGVIEPEHLWLSETKPEFSSIPGNGNAVVNVNLKDMMKAMERHFLIRALKENEWNRTATAKVLGISYSSLMSKLKEHSIRGKIPDMDIPVMPYPQPDVMTLASNL